MIAPILPWHVRAWERLAGVAERKRLAHGLLIAGPDGVGRREFARGFAARLLCERPPPDAPACGECRSCVLFEAGNHPDLARVEPEEGKDQISVDAVRSLIDFMHLSSQFGRFKVAVIDPADAMNRHAANTLLKTLEEPPAGAVLMLVTRRPSILPATIRSRCQVVELAGSEGPEAVRWVAERLPNLDSDAAQLLKLARGAPFDALEMAASGSLEKQVQVLRELRDMRRRPVDPVAVARRWSTLGGEQVLRWLLGFLGEIARRRLHASDGAMRVPAFEEILQPLSDELDLAGVMACYDLTLRNYRGATGLIALNVQGLLEEIVVLWQDMGRRSRG